MFHCYEYTIFQSDMQTLAASEERFNDDDNTSVVSTILANFDTLDIMY